MKVGILTLPLHTNYGGILQAWALQTVLERMGHEVKLIDRPRERHLRFVDRIKITIERIIRKYVLKQNVLFNSEKKHNEEFPIIAQNILPFVDENINRRETYSVYDIREGEFDAFVVGSDQVLRPNYARGYFRGMKNVFLNFAKNWNVRRLFYAPSFGSDEWLFKNFETKECSNLVKRFDAISVREESGVSLFEKYLHVKPQVVLDPTLLLTKEDYISVAKIDQQTINKGKLIYYVLDNNNEIELIIDAIIKDRNLTPLKTNSDYEKSNAKLEDKIQISVEAWLRAFYDAKFVVTDSFHACAFSIIFNKPFVVTGNRDRGMSRFISLLSMTGQEHRLVSSFDEFKTKKKSIYECPNVNLENMRKSSFEFLENVLK